MVFCFRAKGLPREVIPKQIITVGSAALATVGYDDARELLQVEFGGRAIYHYFGVPAAVTPRAVGRAIQGLLLQSGDSRTISVLPDR
jgi:hypothetical protein